jgi:hypothetical protein
MRMQDMMNDWEVREMMDHVSKKFCRYTTWQMMENAMVVWHEDICAEVGCEGLIVHVGWVDMHATISVYEEGCSVAVLGGADELIGGGT